MKVQTQRYPSPPRPLYALILTAFLLLALRPGITLADFQKTKIAVLDFELIGDQLETAGMGAILSEWFTTAIVKSGRFDVVERAMLQKILSEQKLAQTGIIDETSASKLGRILGVKVIITGSVLKLGSSIEINSRVISVESGSIIAAENIRGDSSDDMHGLVDRLTTKIMRNFPLTGYVVKKNPHSAIIDLGLDSGLRPGTEFIVYREGEVIKHPKTGEVLDVEQIITGRLRITRVSQNVAEGDIISEEPEGIAYGQLVKSVQASQVETVKTPVAPTPQSPVASTPSVIVQPPVQPPPAITLAPTKEKIVLEQPAVAQQHSSSKTEPQSPVPSPERSAPEIYNVGLFPWVFFREGDSFKTILADIVNSRISNIRRMELTHSSYHIKGVDPLRLADDPGELWKSSYSTLNTIQSHARKLGLEFGGGSGINLDLLRRKGDELGLHVAIMGKLNVHCRWSDNCQVRNMNFTIVDLVTGQTYSESGSSWDLDAREYIDQMAGKVFRKFTADHGM